MRVCVCVHVCVCVCEIPEFLLVLNYTTYAVDWASETVLHLLMFATAWMGSAMIIGDA